MVKETNKIKLGISMGDMNGIGPEIILKIFSDSRLLDLCTPVIYGSSYVLDHYKRILHLPDLAIQKIKEANMAKGNKVNVIDCLDSKIEIETGKSTEIAGKLSFNALKKATEDVQQNKIDALVTAPLNKMNVRENYDGFSGHTGYLSECDQREALMVLCSEKMRIAMVTGHIPFAQVAQSLTVEKIIKSIEALNKSLKSDFAISKPKIAVLGLNPHAGEEGLMGKEEIDFIGPAVAQVKTKGIIAMGPYPSDGFFGAGRYTDFDGILAMYHDQALIPFKTLSFENGVNFSAGLSFIRTSPDHGTAYEIAGHGKASESSMRSAIYLACDLFKERSEELKMSQPQEA